MACELVAEPGANAALPPPTSGTFLEISFRRLLKSCQEIISGDCKGRDDLIVWQSSPIFHHYVDTLQEQLADLEAHSSRRVDAELLHMYKKHVSRIAGELAAPAVPAFCRPLPPQSIPSAASAPQPTPAPLFARLEAKGAPEASAVRLRPGKASTAQLDSAVRGRLATQDALQETLTDELVGMAAAMRSSTAALEGRLAVRGALLEDADDALQRSLDSTRRSRTQARKIYTRNKIGFCKTCMALLLVGSVFLAMYMFIRVTYFVGYKT